MMTVQELLIAIAIMDDIQEYPNDTDSVDCVPGYSEVRPDIYAHDPEDAADALDDFDILEIVRTMNQPIDYKTRKPFRPELMGIYKLAGSQYCIYQCIAIDDVNHTCTMRNIATGWICDAHDIGIYNNYSIDWSHSTNGHFEKE